MVDFDIPTIIPVNMSIITFGLSNFVENKNKGERRSKDDSCTRRRTIYRMHFYLYVYLLQQPPPLPIYIAALSTRKLCECMFNLFYVLQYVESLC